MLKFLDFDGVIVDSIQECYVVSFKAYYGFSKTSLNTENYKEHFYKYRGLVKPAHEYMDLHRALEKFYKGSMQKIEDLFYESVRSTSIREKELYEKYFFYIRSIYQESDFLSWVEKNPLTSFGKTLSGQDNADVYIVTTKNKEATVALLDFYKIKVKGVYANDEIKYFGNKGNLIKSVMDEKSEQRALFLDDAVEHLDTVKDDRVSCFFADWGYGKNSGYNVYKF
jgi:hypothetical protein